MKSWATPPGELAHSLHLLGLDELRLQRLELGRVREHGEQRGFAVEHRAGEGDLQEDLLTFRLAAGDLGAAKCAALVGVVEPFGDRPPEALDQIGDRRARFDLRAEKLAGGAVGEGEGTVGLEAREGDRQVLEKMVRHEARDLGAVERDEDHIAQPADITQHDRPHRPAGNRRDMHRVGFQRTVTQEIGQRGRERAGKLRGGGVRLQHAVLGIEAHPGHRGGGEIGTGGFGGRQALDPPKQAAGAVAQDGDPFGPVGHGFAGGSVEPGLAAEAVERAAGIGDPSLEQVFLRAGRIAGADAAGEIGEVDRIDIALEIADGVAPAPAPEAGEGGLSEEARPAEHHQRDRQGGGDDHGPGPEAGGRGGEEPTTPEQGEQGAEVSRVLRMDPVRSGLLHVRPFGSLRPRGRGRTPVQPRRRLTEAQCTLKLYHARGARKRARKKPSPPSSGLRRRSPSFFQAGWRAAKAAARSSFSARNSEQVA